MKLLGLAIGCGLVTLAKAAPPDLGDLPVIEQTITIPMPRGTEPMAVIKTFRMIAATPLLTAEINAKIGSDSGALGALERNRVKELHNRGSDEVGHYMAIGANECEVGFATTVFVSWVCRGMWNDVIEGGGGPGVAAIAQGGGYDIEHGRLHVATRATIFAKTGDLDGKLAALGENCHVRPEANVVFPSPQGIEFIEADHNTGCVVSWPDLTPLLAPNSPFPALVQRESNPKPKDPSAGWAKAADRFVVKGETVRDQLTNLEWATHDNGADVSWTEATAYAKAYRGGGNADWRLPTEAELEALSESAGPAHKEKADCTKGKNQLMVSELIHVSCGIAWSSTAIEDDRAVAFGFISGTSRIAKLTEKKNSRALVVRSDAPAKKPPPKK